MSTNAFRKRIAHEQAEGWRVKERGDDWALLHKPNFGTKDAHVLIAVTTVWWTFGFANAAYALLKYWYDTPTKLVEADDPLHEARSSTVTEAETGASSPPQPSAADSRPSTSEPDDTDDTDSDDPDEPPDPLSILRERYARGEIDEAEFERRVERLLETDSTDAAKRSRGRKRDHEPAVERS